MKHTDESFNRIFEQYLLKVANACIDLAEPSTQTDMIKLLTKVSQAGEHTTPVQGSFNSELTEWGQVLDAPINWHSVHEQWLQGVRQVQQNRQQQYVNRLKEAIQATHHRLQQLQVSVLGETDRARLFTYYEQTLLSYQQQLAQTLKGNQSIQAS